MGQSELCMQEVNDIQSTLAVVKRFVGYCAAPIGESNKPKNQQAKGNAMNNAGVKKGEDKDKVHYEK